MKPPTDATVEFRCDCGDLIGWIAPKDDRLVAVMRGRSAAIDGSSWDRRRGWTEYRLPADMSDLREFGLSQSCGRHDRHVVAEHWDLPPAGSRRRKVIVSTNPPL